MITQTFLPVFSGFYNTIWEFSEDNFLYSEGLTFDDIKVDYKQYSEDVVKNICEVLPNYLNNIVKSIEFENIVSPREYNFYNDSANVIIDYNARELKKYLKTNKFAFDAYLHEHYTSRSGFISSYDNNFEGWQISTNNFTNLSGHYLGSMLNFVFYNTDSFLYEDKELNLYYDVIENLYDSEYITILSKHFDDLDNYDQCEVIRPLLSKIDFSFGYLSIIMQQAKEKSNLTGIELNEILLDDYLAEITKFIRIDTVKNETLEPVFIDSSFNGTELILTN